LKEKKLTTKEGSLRSGQKTSPRKRGNGVGG